MHSQNPLNSQYDSSLFKSMSNFLKISFKDESKMGCKFPLASRRLILSSLTSLGLFNRHPVLLGNMIYDPGSRLTSSSHYLSHTKSFNSYKVRTLSESTRFSIAIPASMYGLLLRTPFILSSSWCKVIIM